MQCSLLDAFCSMRALHFLMERIVGVKSRTKNRITNQKIEELTKLHFGQDCGITQIQELEGGMFSAVYLIEMEKGAGDLVLKIGPAPEAPLLTYEQNVMPTEVECLRLIREQTSIPTPEVLAYDFSKTALNSNYFFMTALEGVTLDRVSKSMSRENLVKVKAELGRYLAQLHQIKGSYYGYFTQDPAQQFSTWKEAFSHMFDQLLCDAEARKTRLPYAKIRQVLSDCKVYLKELEIPSLVDFDCHEGNIFVKQVGGSYQIVGIVDFERAFWGDPIGDFPAAFVLADNLDQERDFLCAYMTAVDKTIYSNADAMRYLLYRLYLLTVMATETFRYDPVYAKAQGTWARRNIAKCLRKLIQHKPWAVPWLGVR